MGRSIPSVTLLPFPPEVLATISGVDRITHTMVPEKFRVCDGNKQGVLQQPMVICAGPLCNIFVSDANKGIVLKVRGSHYTANVDVILNNLKSLIGLAYVKGVLFVAERDTDGIVFKDITGETVLNTAEMTVAKIKKKLKELSLWKRNHST